MGLGLTGCVDLVRAVRRDAQVPVPMPPSYQTETHEAEEPLPSIDETAPSPKPADTDANTIEGGWWVAFGDPALTALVDEALQHNFTLRDLRGLYHEDWITPEKPNGPLFPLRIDLPSQVQRQRLGVANADGRSSYPVDFSELDFGVQASYQLDIWGQLELKKKNLEDLALIQQQSAEAQAQNVAVQVAQCWFEILAQRELLELVQRQVKLNEDLKDLVQARFELHLTTRLAVLQQQQQLLNLKAQIPLIGARIALLGSQLTIALGRKPVPDTDLVPRDRRLPELPSLGTPGVPADLVKNSPEVRSAQIRIAEVEHRVSANLAAWLPQISVFASAGTQSFDLGNPFDFRAHDAGQDYKVWALGAKIVWPIWDGGQRVAEAQQLTMTVKRRNMLYTEAFYEAVRKVQDAQIQETKQAANVKTLRNEVELARTVLNEARGLYEQGLSDYLAVLTAFANLDDLERTLIAAERQLLSYRIDLYRALGGTWSKAISDIKD